MRHTEPFSFKNTIENCWIMLHNSTVRAFKQYLRSRLPVREHTTHHEHHEETRVELAKLTTWT